MNFLKISVQIDKLSSDHNKIIKQIDSVKDNVVGQIDTIESMLGENGKLRENIDKILNTIEYEQKVKEALDRKIPFSEMKNSISIFEAEFIKETAKNTKLEIMSRQLEKENTELKVKIENLKIQIDDLTKQLEYSRPKQEVKKENKRLR